jgi:hypothetical protein
MPPVAAPAHGRLTFDAEGQEGGPFHSRVLHVPTASSGLTLGRGYDMKERTRSEIRDHLLAVGLEPAMAALLSQAAGRAGPTAEEFIAENDLEDFEITPEQQVALFDIVYAELAADTERLATKPDVTRAYGATDWAGLDETIREVLIDLRFRGDYTPACRRFLQVHVAANDLSAFAAEIADRERWPNLPADRFARRRDYCNAALG